MTNQKNTDSLLEQEILKLAQEIADLPHRKTGGLVGAPGAIRTRAVDLWQRSGMTAESLGRRLGIAAGSLPNWRNGPGPRGRSVPGARVPKKGPKASSLKPDRAPFRKIEVADPDETDVLARTTAPGSEIVLELGRGARIVGLRLDDVIRLIGLQGGAK